MNRALSLKKRLSRSKNAILSLLVVLAMLLVALSSGTYARATLNGVKLWAFNIVPSVFPYFVLTALLTSLGSAAKLASRCAGLSRRLFGCGGMSAYAFFIAAVSGYPGGSKITAELYEKHLVSADDAYKMSGFCSLSSPLFIVGTAGAMLLKDRAAGFAVLGAHFLSVSSSRECFCAERKRGKTPRRPPFPPPRTISSTKPFTAA